MNTQRRVLGTRGGQGGGMSRRDVLRLAGAGGAAGLLASCGGGDEDGGDPSPSGQGASPSGLPTDDVMVRWLATPDKGEFFEPWFERYTGEHPNIDVVFDGQPQPLDEIIALGVQGGNAHDAFGSPVGFNTPELVAAGWIAPLNDVIPNFDEWKASFPPGSLVFSEFEGQVYAVPTVLPTGINTMLFYSRAMLNDAGYDPFESPLSWDDYRDAARKVTQAGDGDYYGLSLPAGQPNKLARYLAEQANRAGSGTAAYQGGSFNFHTGEFTMADDVHIDVVELLLAMIDDGSVLPGYASMNVTDSIAALDQGQAGMTLDVTIRASNWVRDFPDFDFGVGLPPAPDPATAVPLGAPPGGIGQYHAFVDSPNLAVVGDLFAHLGSQEGNRELFEVIRVNNRPIFEGVFDDIDLTDIERTTTELIDELYRVRPDAQVRNADATLALTEQKPATPNPGQVMQGIITGELEVKQALQDLEDRLNTSLDDAIAAAQAKGVEVSRDDWVFPNWDPMNTYTDDDYAAL